MPKVSFFPEICVITWEIIPNAGRIRIYTSGCPKNQNKCIYKTGSPPPAGSKNEVLKFRSVSNIVIAAANTGSDSKSRITVTKIAHANRGTRSIITPLCRILKVVDIKLIAPRIEEIPAKCSEKMARSTDGPEWAVLPAKGG